MIITDLNIFSVHSFNIPYSLKVTTVGLCFLFFGATAISAQTQNTANRLGTLPYGLSFQPDHQQTIVSNSRMEWFSNFMPSSITFNSLARQQVPTSNLTKAAALSRDVNQVGLSINQSVSYCQWQNGWLGPTWGQYVEMGFAQFTSGQFSGELLQIVAAGNAAFAGQQVSFGDVNQALNFQSREVGFGITKAIFKKRKAYLKAGLKFASLSNLTSIQTQSSYLFTDTYGEFIELGYDYTAYQSGNAWNSGFGLTGNFALIAQTAKNSYFGIELSQIGMGFWRSGSTNIYQQAGTARVEGIELKVNEVNAANSQDADAYIDSLQNTLTPTGQASNFQMAMPWQLRFHYATQVSKNLSTYVQGIYNYQFSIYPTVMGGMVYQQKWIKLGMQAGLTRAGTFGVNLYVGADFKHVSIALESYGADALVTNSRNTAVQVQIAYLLLK